MEPAKEYNEKAEWEKSNCNRRLIVLNESWLIGGAIPIVAIYLLGAISCLVWMLRSNEYDKWIVTEKLNKIANGDNPDDVMDYLDWHLQGTGIWWFTLTAVYGMILFRMSHYLFNFEGVIFCVTLILTFLFNIVSFIWLMIDSCSDTDAYAMSIVNNIVIVVAVPLSFIVIIVFYLRFGCQNSISQSKVSIAHTEERLQGSDDRDETKINLRDGQGDHSNRTGDRNGDHWETSHEMRRKKEDNKNWDDDENEEEQEERQPAGEGEDDIY